MNCNKVLCPDGTNVLLEKIYAKLLDLEQICCVDDNSPMTLSLNNVSRKIVKLQLCKFVCHYGEVCNKGKAQLLPEWVVQQICQHQQVQLSKELYKFIQVTCTQMVLFHLLFNLWVALLCVWPSYAHNSTHHHTHLHPGAQHSAGDEQGAQQGHPC
jgi:hypothetical protein